MAPSCARHVHAILAAALAEPDLLDQWRRDREPVIHRGVTREELDLDALWRFAGLMTKVRHNDLRKGLPLTFRLLDISGIEIDLFARYALHAAQSGSKCGAGKQESLFAFFEGELSRDEPMQALIWDIIRHERVIIERWDPSGEIPDLREPVCQSSIPIRRGMLTLCEMSCNPVELAKELRRPLCNIELLRRGRFQIAYWRATTSSCIHILELDELSFILLNLTNGTRSAADMCVLLSDAGVVLTEQDVCRSLQELVEHGLLSTGSSSRE
jgi:hypothetical protein